MTKETQENMKILQKWVTSKAKCLMQVLAMEVTK